MLIERQQRTDELSLRFQQYQPPPAPGNMQIGVRTGLVADRNTARSFVRFELTQRICANRIQTLAPISSKYHQEVAI